MDGSIIYDAFQGEGADNGALGAVVFVTLLTAGLIYFALVMRWARKRGIPVNSISKKATTYRNFVGRYSLQLIVAGVVVAVGITAPVLARYQRDRKLLERGDYATWTGTVAQYNTVEIRANGRSRFDHVAGLQPSLHERDQLVVDGRVFFVQCDHAFNDNSVDQPGECLRLRTGQKVRVDYVQVSPTQYRAEPLRIWQLNQ